MTSAHPVLRRELSLRDLVLFNLAAIISTRWIGVAAHVGPGSLSLWVLAALFFLIPSAFVVANLSSKFPEQGGLYVWTREAFGPWHAFACAWFYYINNLFWIPGVLISVVGMVAYPFTSRLGSLAENPRFVLPCALIVLLVITATNYVGLRWAKWVDNLGGSAVYLLWAILLVSALASISIKGSVTKFVLAPEWNFGKLNFWSQLAMAMTGLELSPILSGEIRNARRSIFRATWISAGGVLVFYLVSTAAILVFLQPDNVSTVVGLAQTGQQISNNLGWKWVTYLVALCILLSVGGQIGTYLGACARLPFVLGIESLLPPAFAKLHPRFGTPYVSILFLGIGSGFLLLLSQLGETFRGAYQVTVDMTVISLFVPFLYIFAAAWKFGQKLSAVCGLAVSALAVVFSFLPTADVKSVWGFEVKLLGGCIFLYAIAFFFYGRYRPVAA